MSAEQHIRRENREPISHEASGSRVDRGLPAVGTGNSDVSGVSLVRSWYRRFHEYMPAANNHRSEPTRAALRTAETLLACS